MAAAGGGRLTVNSARTDLTFQKAWLSNSSAEGRPARRLLCRQTPKQAPAGCGRLKNWVFLTPNIDWKCLNADAIRHMKALHPSARSGFLLNAGWIHGWVSLPY